MNMFEIWGLHLLIIPTFVMIGLVLKHCLFIDIKITDFLDRVQSWKIKWFFTNEQWYTLTKPSGDDDAPMWLFTWLVFDLVLFALLACMAALSPVLPAIALTLLAIRVIMIAIRNKMEKRNANKAK